MHELSFAARDGAVLVCDMTRPETLESLRAYAAMMSRVNPHARFVVAANKDDLITGPGLAEERLQALAAELRASYFLTSAKTGDAVEAVFHEYIAHWRTDRGYIVDATLAESMDDRKIAYCLTNRALNVIQVGGHAPILLIPT